MEDGLCKLEKAEMKEKYTMYVQFPEKCKIIHNSLPNYLELPYWIVSRAVKNDWED